MSADPFTMDMQDYDALGEDQKALTDWVKREFPDSQIIEMQLTGEGSVTTLEHYWPIVEIHSCCGFHLLGIKRHRYPSTPPPVWKRKVR